jgi:hypothetical protein
VADCDDAVGVPCARGLERRHRLQASAGHGPAATHPELASSAHGSRPWSASDKPGHDERPPGVSASSAQVPRLTVMPFDQTNGARHIGGRSRISGSTKRLGHSFYPNFLPRLAAFASPERLGQRVGADDRRTHPASRHGWNSSQLQSVPAGSTRRDRHRLLSNGPRIARSAFWAEPNSACLQNRSGRVTHG